ncbi:MAG: glycoside hydrolase family 13 protein [Bacteroidia bacterium]
MLYHFFNRIANLKTFNSYCGKRPLPLLLLLLLLLNPIFSFSQDVDIKRIDPPFWFTMMNEPKVQLCVYGSNISKYNVTVNYPGVTLEKVNKVENPNYLFLDLSIDLNTKPGVLPIKFSITNKSFSYSYELRSRVLSRSRAQGLTPADLIYLIMPDRFANAETSNDIVSTMNQKTVNRDSLGMRHGGDIRGIMKNMPYLKFLGVTALWLNPVVENNQPNESYHGYAFTDHYKIDPRLGTNEIYQQFVEFTHNAKMKVVFDVVLNHIGNEHWFFKDLPSKDWVHQWTEFTRTTYKDGTLMDPYAAESDKTLMTDGWFDKHMPDLNQKNPFVAQYLIENSIWWIETTGIDAYRVDTYAYSDLDFENKWIKAIQYEYPKFSIFGETWVNGITNQSYFAKSKYTQQKFYSELPGVTDFQLYFAINDALNQKFGWTEGVNRLYHTLSSDFVYDDPSRNVTFVDNHDLSRYFSVCGEDMNKWKMGITFLFTTRGIPMIYYGTEILMKNYANGPASNVRNDFPGGWETDSLNKFKPEGRTAQENEAHAFITKLANWRQFRKAITEGKLTQFVPVDGIYVYFRYTIQQTIMVVMNSNDKEMKVETKRFAERIQNYKTAYEVTTDKSISDIGTINVPAKTAWILELK